MEDKYDRAIQRARELELCPEQLHELWGSAPHHPEAWGVSDEDAELIATLFNIFGSMNIASKEGPPKYVRCGCVTQIAYDNSWKPSSEIAKVLWGSTHADPEKTSALKQLQKEIEEAAAEGLIPNPDPETSPGLIEDNIHLSDLEIFAKFQRRFDEVRALAPTTQ